MQQSEVTILCNDLPPAIRASLEKVFAEATKAAQKSLIAEMSEALSRQLSSG